MKLLQTIGLYVAVIWLIMLTLVTLYSPRKYHVSTLQLELPAQQIWFFEPEMVPHLDEWTMTWENRIKLQYSINGVVQYVTFASAQDLTDYTNWLASLHEVIGIGGE